VPDGHDLERFVTAQDNGDVYRHAVAELRAGRKRTHWMWFVFPQIEGLGASPTSRHFALAGIDEARAFLQHPVLGPRLVECAGLVVAAAPATAEEIFGAVDAMKLRSSMTLFSLAAPDQPTFAQVLDRFFEGQPDPETVRRAG
jgi:uncharacterized protein (DUF1810 family)